MIIRELVEEDTDSCFDIVMENWDKKVAYKFLDEVYHSRIGTGEYVMEWPPEYYVVEVEGKVVAFAGMMWSWIMSGVMDFIWVNVDKDHQGCGYGAALTEHRIEECRKRGVKVINLMTQKPNFFEVFGFVMTYVYKGTWFSMTKQLAPLNIHDD